MRLARNMAAGMANSVVVVLVNLAVLPVYLRLLGMEAYGLIGFYATLQAVLQVLDLGLSPTVSREIAHGAETGQQRRSASLLRTLGTAYIVIAVVVAGGVALVAPWVSTHWLQAGAIPADTVAQAIALMGVNLACRWPISLYHGALAGSHRLLLSAVTSMIVNICAAFASVAVLTWGVASIQAFFVVQAVFGLVQTIALRALARGALGESVAPYDFRGLRRVWKFSAWMSGIAVTSLAFTQLDKILLSRLVGLESLGHYMLATLIVSGLSVLTGPAFNVIYPKFTTLFARRDEAALARFYSNTSRIYVAAVFSLAMAVVLHAEVLVALWTGRTEVASHVAPIVELLAIGSALNSIMYFPYALQLASGRPRIPLAINAALLLLAIPTTIWLATRFGVLGGALSWASLGCVYLIVGTVVTGRRVATFAGPLWLARDVLIPALLSICAALMGASLSNALHLTPWATIFVAILSVGLGVVAGVLYSPFSRQEMFSLIGRRVRQ